MGQSMAKRRKPLTAKAKRAAKPVAKKKASAKKAATPGKPIAKKAAAKKPVAKKQGIAKPIARVSARRPVKDRPSVARVPAPRPAPHKAPLQPHNIYERDLDKTPANYAPLTPLQFIERTASVYPDHPAIIHGPRRQSWAETYRRCRRLASALERQGIGVGDT